MLTVSGSCEIMNAFIPVYFDQSQCSCGHLLLMFALLMQNMLKVKCLLREAF